MENFDVKDLSSDQCMALVIIYQSVARALRDPHAYPPEGRERLAKIIDDFAQDVKDVTTTVLMNEALVEKPERGNA